MPALQVTLAFIASWSLQAIHFSTTCWGLQEAAKRSTRHAEQALQFQWIERDSTPIGAQTEHTAGWAPAGY